MYYSYSAGSKIINFQIRYLPGLELLPLLFSFYRYTLFFKQSIAPCGALRGCVVIQILLEENVFFISYLA